MGEETTQFASRFATAVSELEQLADDEGHAQLRHQHGAALRDVVRDALDAIAAVYETGTHAVRNWPEQRRHVLSQVAATRTALDRRGVDGEVRAMARALVELIEPSARP
ncbi:hypothetical protein [Anaeromyxobacter oryzae]|uniref:Uncharacterized protein n=1 Tax=Anaeromyxobacter oryzae TaxID=2918170 RepID=A0ABM7WPH2_9BACT|nr:hypothetical protein [Anaeromyxobacter oryzae]BDG01359.1 hypothetical protein AMOR_03550 [Anaeromyxobacter oryzae]